MRQAIDPMLRARAAVWLVPIVLAGCAVATTSTEAPPDPDLGIAIRDAMQDESDAHWFGAAADLDGDGRDERIAYVASPMVCGTGGCPLWVFARVSQGWRVVSQTSVTRPPVRLAPRQTNGWRNLVVRVAGGGLPARDVELAFDGRRYPANPTTVPAAAAHDAAALPVLIAGFASYRDGRPVPPAAFGDRSLPVAATVQGYAVHTREADELRVVVMQRLTDRFAAERGIGVTDAERDAYLRDVDATLRARGITPERTDDAEERAAREQVAVLFVRQWKIHRALFERHGGRVGFQQGGPEPLDALRTLAEAAQARGDLVFHDHALEAAFWRYFRNDEIHQFHPPAGAARMFEHPPWAATR
ncbi:hypothetical protein [uncultured Piscinibacter sp.]|uniref:hypothetical protein n=1 Tax=uncultured Piscinibacter sp. TaxID=1131835 RepID=UPI0026227BAA|nr:hypothetical protein [uncultured Piscinibacter sp.]